MSDEQSDLGDTAQTDIVTNEDEVGQLVEELYNNSKHIVLLTCLGLFVPIVLLVAAPLGVHYAIQRSWLLRRVDSGELAVTERAVQKVRYLRQHPFSFWSPAIVLGLWLLAVGVYIVW